VILLVPSSKSASSSNCVVYDLNFFRDGGEELAFPEDALTRQLACVRSTSVARLSIRVRVFSIAAAQ
ncbi:unnamed protein product, partial [Rotaria socialis]